MSVMIPEEVATLAGGPEPIGPPGEPPLAPAGPPPEMGGPPPGIGGPGPTPSGGGGEIDILEDALNSLMQYLQVANDDIEKAKAMQAAKIVQDLLAKNQSEQEAAAGVGPAQRGMAKALGG